MTVKKYNLAWIAGVNVSQVIEGAYDSESFAVIAGDISKDETAYTLMIPATVKTAIVRIGSFAPGQKTIYSAPVTFSVADTIKLTAATGLSVIYIGEEEVA